MNKRSKAKLMTERNKKIKEDEKLKVNKLQVESNKIRNAPKLQIEKNEFYSKRRKLRLHKGIQKENQVSFSSSMDN